MNKPQALEPHQTSAAQPVSVADKKLNQELRRIAAMMRSVQLDLNKVAREMNKVDSLANDILKHVNSPGLGLQHNISKVEHAVALLGQRRTLQLIESRLPSEEEASSPMIDARKTA